MTIRLYGFWRSIASYRVRVALKMKALPLEEVSIDILVGDQFNDDYAEINAERVVPTLVHDGVTLFQSLAILEYLDEIAPTPRLLPEDAKERAYARSLALVTVADAHPLIVPRMRKHLTKTFGADDHAVEGWGAHWTAEGLATYERLLWRRSAKPFALGAEPGLADICIAGHAIAAQYFKVDLADYPLVAALVARCNARPEFASSHPFEQAEFKKAQSAH